MILIRVFGPAVIGHIRTGVSVNQVHFNVSFFVSLPVS